MFHKAIRISIVVILVMAVVASFGSFSTVRAQEKQARIAFRFLADWKGNWQLYTVNADGTDIQQLTSVEDGVGKFLWSPDGEQILFSTGKSDFLPDSELYVVSVDGGTLRRLPGSGILGSWSPDSRQIAITSFEGSFRIIVMNADGSNRHTITNDGVDPAWSPDGTKLAFWSNTSQDNAEIFVINADGTGKQQITTSVREDMMPVWSPDGTKIAFNSYPHGLFEDDQIFVVNADGSNSHELTQGLKSTYSPAWSPDGSQIAFFGTPTQDAPYVPSHIYVMSLYGSGVRRLSDTDNEPFSWRSSPSWTSDGTKIAYTVDSNAILTVNSDGSGSSRQIVYRAGYVIDSPIWQPQPRTPSGTQ